jgi:hypothetical protein
MTLSRTSSQDHHSLPLPHILQHQFRCPLTQHKSSHSWKSPRTPRKRTRIHNPQPGHAFHPESCIQHRHRITVGTNFIRARGVVAKDLVLYPLPVNSLILTVPCFVDLEYRARRRDRYNGTKIPFCSCKGAADESHGVEDGAHIYIRARGGVVHIYFWHLRRILTLNLNLPRRILRMYLHR